MGYFEKESAPSNLVLPRPVAIPTGFSSMLYEQTEELAALHKLVDKLDAKEVKIVTQYVANVLLVNVQVHAERTNAAGR